MEYISIKEISVKWQMKERKVTALCRENRIAGARKIGKNWLIPSDALKPIDKRTKEFENIQKLNNNDSVTYANGDERVKSTFKNKYKKDPMYLTFTPYRICLLGNNTLNNLGQSIGFAIDKGIHMAYSIKQNGVIELEFLQFPKRAQCHILNTPSEKQNDWADCLRSTTIALSKRYALKYGLSGIIDSELPVSSLSLSNAIIITFLNALAFINNIKLKANELIEIVKEIETYGGLNPTCEIYAEKNKLLYMDMLDDSYKLINKPANMPPFVIGIFSIDVDNNVNNYNIHVDELRSVAYLLKAFSNMEYSTFNKTNLREVPYEIFVKYKDKLPVKFAKKAEHFYNEIKRVEKGVKAYQKGDIDALGKLVTESSDSFIENFGIDSLELTKLYEILKKNKGIYGVRISEVDFKGCCIALINPKYENEIMQLVKEKYTSYICHTADGVKL